MPLRTKEVLAGKFFCISFTGHAWNYGPAHSASRVGEEVFSNISASKEDWGNVPITCKQKKGETCLTKRPNTDSRNSRKKLLVTIMKSKNKPPLSHLPVSSFYRGLNILSELTFSLYYEFP